MPSLGAWENYRTPHCLAGKWKNDFYLQNYHNYNISNSSFAPMRTYNTPYCPKQEQNYCHSASHNHSYPSWWLLLTTNCRLGRWCTCRIATESKVTVQVGFTVFWSLWCCVQKLVQVPEKCLNCTTDQPIMFINGVWTWMVLPRVSHLANGTLYASFCSCNMYFQFLGALFWSNLGT